MSINSKYSKAQQWLRFRYKAIGCFPPPSSDSQMQMDRVLIFQRREVCGLEGKVEVDIISFVREIQKVSPHGPSILAQVHHICPRQEIPDIPAFTLKITRQPKDSEQSPLIFKILEAKQVITNHQKQQQEIDGHIY